MSTHVTNDNPSALTSLTDSYFDGTDTATSMQPGYFTAPANPDAPMPAAEAGADGIVGPVQGAHHVDHPAQPGNTGL